MRRIDSKEFGERLRVAIKTAGVTQKDIAQKINISKTAVNNYVGGRIPNAIILYRISNFLNTTIEWLFTGENPVSSNASFNEEEFELISLYTSCCEKQKKDIAESIKSYLLNPNYNFKKSADTLSEDELNILELFRKLNTRDKIKIEGIIELKLSDSKRLKKGLSSNCQNGEEVATSEKKHA
ncbi:MAG: hypothetical protein COA82_12315 [Alkaliphilus sp.]|nr:helix-turn-helix transcriptional regulator [Alkaliphilus transvaalensis]PHS29779.1 MAG: hypothetical protein COA82_12315 [Alkaliphilus sp.]